MGLLLLLLLVVVVAEAEAWGKEGHFMTCKIAENFLTDEAAAAVKDLLPAVADLQGDCHDTKGVKDRCVVGAINNYTAALKDSSSPFDPTESLMFLSHFVGDVHQPLHCGHADDLGGNTIIVHWYTRKGNLHHVWDVSVIETAMKDFYDNDQATMIEAIQSNITEVWSNEEKQWEACRLKTKTCAETYAKESALLACDAYEGVEQDITLGDDYFFKALPVVQKRIAQGGVRLAAILNRIFSGKNVGLQSS